MERQTNSFSFFLQNSVSSYGFFWQETAGDREKGGERHRQRERERETERETERGDKTLGEVNLL